MENNKMTHDTDFGGFIAGLCMSTILCGAIMCGGLALFGHYSSSNYVREESKKIYYREQKDGSITIGHNYCFFHDTDGDKKTAEKVIFVRPITNTYTFPDKEFYAPMNDTTLLKEIAANYNYKKIMTNSEYEYFNREYQELLRHKGEPSPLTKWDMRGSYFKYKE